MKRKPKITLSKLHKLEEMLYKMAVDGNTTLGLNLLKLYYKDLGMVDKGQTDDGSKTGLVCLPITADDNNSILDALSILP